MLAGAFPLVIDMMFRKMSFAGASSFLGGIGALLTTVPWVLVFYGPRIRARSKFASVSVMAVYHPSFLSWMLLANMENRNW
jgi:hypothetical protein